MDTALGVNSLPPRMKPSTRVPSEKQASIHPTNFRYYTQRDRFATIVFKLSAEINKPFTRFRLVAAIFGPKSRPFDTSRRCFASLRYAFLTELYRSFSRRPCAFIPIIHAGAAMHGPPMAAAGLGYRLMHIAILWPLESCRRARRRPLIAHKVAASCSLECC